MKNFPFEYNGETLWYSRSLAAACVVFCYNIDNQLCVLANKRGPGCEFNSGKWNVPGGFIDFNETAEYTATRELFEETGVKINPENIHFVALKTKPVGKRQTMTAVFSYEYSDSYNAEEIETTNEYSEPDEVDEIKWIPISELDNYDWTREQVENIHLALAMESSLFD